MDERRELRQADRFGKEALKPEKDVTAEDGFNVVLIDGRVVFTHDVRVRPVLISTNHGVLVSQGNPVVRDEGGRQDCVGTSALRAPYPANADGMDAIRKEDASFIVSMNGKTGRVATGAAKLLELEGVNDRIVIIL